VEIFLKFRVINNFAFLPISDTPNNARGFLVEIPSKESASLPV
jgi:hypothetical protein